MRQVDKVIDELTGRREARRIVDICIRTRPSSNFAQGLISLSQLWSTQHSCIPLCSIEPSFAPNHSHTGRASQVLQKIGYLADEVEPLAASCTSVAYNLAC